MLHTLPFVQVWAWPKEMSIDDIHKARAKLQENMEVGAVRLDTCDTMFHSVRLMSSCLKHTCQAAREHGGRRCTS